MNAILAFLDPGVWREYWRELWPFIAIPFGAGGAAGYATARLVARMRGWLKPFNRRRM